MKTIDVPEVSQQTTHVNLGHRKGVLDQLQWRLNLLR